MNDFPYSFLFQAQSEMKEGFFPARLLRAAILSLSYDLVVVKEYPNYLVAQRALAFRYLEE